MAAYESLYPGATFLLDPNYNFTGYRIPSGHFGATTSIQTANQLKEVNNLLNQGIKQTEVSIINPEVFEMIPKEMFSEIKRLNKLTGAESSLHAPTIDPAGFSDQGWSEENRKAVQRQFEEVVLRGHDIDPTGNIPVTIHASGIPGSQVIPTKGSNLITDEEKKSGKTEVIGRMVAVDQESGKPIFLERERRYYPLDVTGKKEGDGAIYSPERELEEINNTHWQKQLSQLLYYKERGDDILRQNYDKLIPELSKNISDEEKNAAKQNIQNASIFLEDSYQNLKTLFHQAYKFSDENGKQKLLDVANKVKPQIENGLKNDPIALSNGVGNLITLMKEVTELNPPKQIVPIENFARDKASETLSQVAATAYKKYGDTAPIISIENPPYGFAIASGSELKQLVEMTRQKFVDKMVKEGKSPEEANNAAQRLIGVTWDTSHMSMIRKQGFDASKVTEETKIIAPYVKHVHFNDNFGNTHTDLPPGMGNLPIKDIMNELEKVKFKGKKVFEGGNYFQHFQKSPFVNTLMYSGSPLYSGSGPYWNQLGGLGNYYGGHGPVNPQIHHSIYGSSFSSLPVELGGEVPGMSSRFSGTPNK